MDRLDPLATMRPASGADGLLDARFAAQRRAFDAERCPSFATRLDRLNRLLEMTDRLLPEIAAAISADFGHRSSQVTRMADGQVTRSAILHARRRLRGWMKTRRVPTAAPYWPGKSHERMLPVGVVGIVSPWNYPYQLAISPAASAIAAGNRVMVKPSEATPRLAALLQRAVAERFAADEITVVTGDADIARAFVALPFDHLLFTGSTAVGRQVALAAAANLTPVTLELGGKSPAILNADCNLAEAVPRLVAAKLLNTGQTCIAPDYLLVHESLVDAIVPAMREAALRFYPTIDGNPDYSSIASDRHAARLQALLDDAQAHGATVVPLHTETATRSRRMPPFAVVDVDDRMRLMREEIFGPLLPIVIYRTLDDAIAYVNARDRPLALYWFGRSAADRDRVLVQTLSGGATVNDCLWHVAQEGLAFGGIGASGMGCYHGEHGFRTFSHRKSVFVQSPHAGTGLMAPPYGRAFEWLAKWVRWIG